MIFFVCWSAGSYFLIIMVLFVLTSQWWEIVANKYDNINNKIILTYRISVPMPMPMLWFRHVLQLHWIRNQNNASRTWTKQQRMGKRNEANNQISFRIVYSAISYTLYTYIYACMCCVCILRKSAIYKDTSIWFVSLEPRKTEKWIFPSPFITNTRNHTHTQEANIITGKRYAESRLDLFTQ